MSGRVHLLWQAFSSLRRSSDVETLPGTRPDTFLCSCKPCGRCLDAGYARGTKQTGSRYIAADPYKGVDE